MDLFTLCDLGLLGWGEFIHPPACSSISYWFSSPLMDWVFSERFPLRLVVGLLLSISPEYECHRLKLEKDACGLCAYRPIRYNVEIVVLCSETHCFPLWQEANSLQANTSCCIVSLFLLKSHCTFKFSWLILRFCDVTVFTLWEALQEEVQKHSTHHYINRESIAARWDVTTFIIPGNDWLHRPAHIWRNDYLHYVNYGFRLRRTQTGRDHWRDAAKLTYVKEFQTVKLDNISCVPQLCNLTLQPRHRWIQETVTIREQPVIARNDFSSVFSRSPR